MAKYIDLVLVKPQGQGFENTKLWQAPAFSNLKRDDVVSITHNGKEAFGYVIESCTVELGCDVYRMITYAAYRSSNPPKKINGYYRRFDYLYGDENKDAYTATTTTKTTFDD